MTPTWHPDSRHRSYMSNRNRPAGSKSCPPLSQSMTAKTYPSVRVTFRPATDHGQLQKVAELVLAAETQTANSGASPNQVRRELARMRQHRPSEGRTW